MPFSPEDEQEFRKLEEEGRLRWEAMSEQEKDEIREASKNFARKAQSCYENIEPIEK